MNIEEQKKEIEKILYFLNKPYFYTLVFLDKEKSKTFSKIKKEKDKNKFLNKYSESFVCKTDDNDIVFSIFDSKEVSKKYLQKNITNILDKNKEVVIITSEMCNLYNYLIYLYNQKIKFIQIYLEDDFTMIEINKILEIIEVLLKSKRFNKTIDVNENSKMIFSVPNNIDFIKENLDFLKEKYSDMVVHNYIALSLINNIENIQKSITIAVDLNENYEEEKFNLFINEIREVFIKNFGQEISCEDIVIVFFKNHDILPNEIIDKVQIW